MRLAISMISLARDAGMGLLFGSSVIGVTAASYDLMPDLVIPPQSVLLGLVGWIFGIIPALVAVACSAAFVLFQNDISASVAVASILASGVFGLGWRMARKSKLEALKWNELFIFGITLHLFVVGIVLSLPSQSLAGVFTPSALGALGIYLFITVFFGKLLAASFPQRASSERLQLTFHGAHEGGAEAHGSGDAQAEIGFRLRHREGHYVSVISSGHAQYDAVGKAVRVSGTDMDVTPLQRELEKANAAKFWLESAGRIARIGYWEFSFDTQRMMWSDITCEIHEVPRHSTPDLTEVLSYYPGEYQTAITRDLERLRSLGQPFTGEYQIITAKGRPIWVQSRGEPISDDVGRAIGARGVIQDIDAQKRATEALAESERNYHEIFDGTADAIFIHDEHDGRIIDVNDAMLRMYGFPDKASALACKLYELSLGEPPYSAEDERRHIKAALEQGPQVFEWHTRRADRSTFWVEVSLRRSEIGGQGRLLACCRDISRRKELEARVREADKMESLGRLAGGVAHDFNNMLGVIIGHTDLAEFRLDDGQCPRGNLAEIRSAALRSAALVRQLLTFARQQKMTPAVIDLNHAVDNALSLLRRLIGEHIALDWQPSSGLWPIKIDPTQIDQILTNLAVNARDAMEENGAITVRTFNESAEAADRVTIEFSDNGSGMDPETLKRVFEPFFTTKDVGNGTGLGLSTVYGIVEQNSGAIEVKSRPGHGTTFRIHFPKAVEAVQTSEKNSGDPLPPTVGTETILLVEDEPGILQIATMALRLKGYSVFPISTPQSALAFAAEDDRTIDLVISDVIMPEINGRALREKILASRPRIKFLFISGYSGDVLGDLDLNDPSIAFLGKPFSAGALADKVRRCLDAEQSPGGTSLIAGPARSDCRKG